MDHDDVHVLDTIEEMRTTLNNLATLSAALDEIEIRVRTPSATPAASARTATTASARARPYRPAMSARSQYEDDYHRQYDMPMRPVSSPRRTTSATSGILRRPPAATPRRAGPSTSRHVEYDEDDEDDEPQLCDERAMRRFLNQNGYLRPETYPEIPVASYALEKALGDKIVKGHDVEAVKTVSIRNRSHRIPKQVTFFTNKMTESNLFILPPPPEPAHIAAAWAKAAPAIMALPNRTVNMVDAEKNENRVFLSVPAIAKVLAEIPSWANIGHALFRVCAAHHA